MLSVDPAPRPPGPCDTVTHNETWRTFPRAGLSAESVEVAPLLLNTLVVVGERVGRIVEVEAYAGPEDPASHAYRGMTPRTASMFGPAGTLYTYLSYGVHTCANISTGEADSGQAVLLRAIEPLEGIDAMRSVRKAARRDVDLGNGPGKLCAALGITLDHDGVDVCDPVGPVRLFSDGTPPPTEPVRTPRVGISRAKDRPWRFVVPGSPFASRGPRGVGADHG